MLRKSAIVLTLVILGVMFVAVATSVHPFGAPPAVMDDYIIQNSQEQTGTNNVVAAVVFDYRGYDTLGEATILFTSVTAVVMLLRRRSDEAVD